MITMTISVFLKFRSSSVLSHLPYRLIFEYINIGTKRVHIFMYELHLQGFISKNRNYSSRVTLKRDSHTARLSLTTLPRIFYLIWCVSVWNYKGHIFVVWSVNVSMMSFLLLWNYYWWSFHTKLCLHDASSLTTVRANAKFF